MGIISFLSEMIGMMLDKGELEETETTHSKFVSSVVDTLRSGKASNEDVMQALRHLGAIVYIGTSEVTSYIGFKKINKSDFFI